MDLSAGSESAGGQTLWLYLTFDLPRHLCQIGEKSGVRLSVLSEVVTEVREVKGLTFDPASSPSVIGHLTLLTRRG